MGKIVCILLNFLNINIFLVIVYLMEMHVSDTGPRDCRQPTRQQRNILWQIEDTDNGSNFDKNEF